MNLKRNISVLLFICLLSFLLHGCGYIRNKTKKHYYHLEYTKSLQNKYTGPTRGLKLDEPLEKEGVINLLIGSQVDSINPEDVNLSEDFRNQMRKKKDSNSLPDSPKFSFIHLSDIQVRDRVINWLGKNTSNIIDKYVETLENNFYQDHSDAFYLAYILKAIRYTMDVTDVNFVIHTGDALHVGGKSELVVFNEMINKFILNHDYSQNNDIEAGNKLSWLQADFITESDKTKHYYNIIGNHDVLSWGNFSKNIYKNHIRSINDLAGYLDRSIYQTDDILSGGYYTHDANMSDGTKIRLIMLNTNESNNKYVVLKALNPSISEKQYKWLNSVLNKSAEVEAVLVFGHNPVEEVSVGGRGESQLRLLKLLDNCDKVKGYFCGHVHSGRLTSHPEGAHFNQFVVPSVQEYPKCFSIVNIEKRQDGKFVCEREFYNIEDLVDDPSRTMNYCIQELKLIDIKYLSFWQQLKWWKYNYQKMFENWLDMIKESEFQSPSERIHLLAEAAYQTAQFDLSNQNSKGEKHEKLMKDNINSWSDLKEILRDSVVLDD